MLQYKSFNGITFLFVLVLILSNVLFADENAVPMEWGKVPPEHIAMNSFPGDSNASAIILFDYGEVTFDGGYDMIFTRHKRIKILTSAGFDQGTVKVNYYTKESTQHVSEIEAVTLTPQPDGSIKEQELDEDEFFKEKLSENWETIKFTFPSLSPGCIIEYQYTIKSSGPHFAPDWSFQTSEPTLWSEFILKSPPVYQYAFVFQGYENPFIKTNQISRETFMAGSGPQVINMTILRWVLKDVPAIREEDFITTLDDYTSKVTLQLASIHWPGEMQYKILDSWENVIEEILKHENFGRQLDGYGAVRKQTQYISENIQDTVKKIEAIYDFIRRSIEWNKKKRLTADEDLDDVLEKKSGSSAEINLLLTLMLREAGIVAQPVILSTRDNGRIQTVYQIVNQFNYVITRAVAGGKEYLLDATDRVRPMDILPYRALNHTGLLVEKGPVKWISIEPKIKSNTTTATTLTMSNDGSVNGKIIVRYSDYSGFKERNNLISQTENDFIKSVIQTETSGFAVDSFSIANKDSIIAPLNIEASVTNNTYAQVLDSFIYVNPMTIELMKDNPFKLETRKFPVDFAFPQTKSYVLNLTIPEGYTLKNPPENISLNLPNNGGTFKRICNLAENKFQYTTKLDINQIVFSPQEYQTLRNFYERIINLQSEQIAFQKATPLIMETNKK